MVRTGALTAPKPSAAQMRQQLLGGVRRPCAEPLHRAGAAPVCRDDAVLIADGAGHAHEQPPGALLERVLAERALGQRARLAVAAGLEGEPRSLEPRVRPQPGELVAALGHPGRVDALEVLALLEERERVEQPRQTLLALQPGGLGQQRLDARGVAGESDGAGEAQRAAVERGPSPSGSTSRARCTAWRR